MFSESLQRAEMVGLLLGLQRQWRRVSLRGLVRCSRVAGALGLWTNPFFYFGTPPKMTSVNPSRARACPALQCW